MRQFSITRKEGRLAGFEVTYKILTGDLGSGHIDRYPDTCPFCKRGGKPEHHSTLLTDGNYEAALVLVLQCPLQDCRTVYFGKYSKPFKMRMRDMSIDFYLRDVSLLRHTKVQKFQKSVISISPKFGEIYNEAYVAEVNELKEICGPGYRRALEFLIKDYLIHLAECNDPEIEKIKKSFLGDCIRQIDDENVKLVAKRASWLGNDETHYTRKWEDHDIQDLKNLIELTVSCIAAAELTKQYVEEMPDGR